ncbi:PqiC family protein [Variovorax sp. PBL-E5]|uniref:PqiC family protein n=1 Tax=Variovorax sp. PBL-E5 TaxID=434014 RepID=UPI001316465A|nr:PqiC family protein [Variovorax sp. PBL-E5]VTU28975.1 ABC-type uncharacterized transport system, auxiliary component [Variovorax sp. PBL-E5]
MKAMLSRAAALIAVLVLAAGCASPPPQYYSLADDTLRSAPAAAGAAPLFIELAPVAMPERFARPQMVVRQKGAADSPQVDILEEHRWSSSFENELRDALASGIAGRLGAVDATRSGLARGRPVVRIAVQLRQFDAVENSRVDAGFSWTVRRADEGPSSACQLSLSEPVDRGLDALAAGAQRVTAKLADAIARSVSAMSSQPAAACPA